MSCGGWCSDPNNSVAVVEPVPAETRTAQLPLSTGRQETELTVADADPDMKYEAATEQNGVAGTTGVASLESLAPKEDQGNPGPCQLSIKKDIEPGERRIVIKSGINDNVVPSQLNTMMGGKPNYLQTAQFTPLTWLPKSLFNQFKRIANIYFLFIAVIVLFGSFVIDFSPKDWRSKIGPFMLVLFWTACKDLFEDMRRRKDDKAENMQVAKKYSFQTEQLENVKWCDVLVGDVLYVPCDAAFPTDLILLKASGNETAFISTVMLDGETSLKERTMPKVFLDVADTVTEADLQKALPEYQRDGLAFMKKLSVGCEVKMGVPSSALSDIRGLVMVEGAKSDYPVGESNFLPRGCILRNTPYVLALSVYVGGDTKTRLNATQASLKFSNMQIALNLCVRLLLVFIFSVCLFATIMSAANVFGAEEPRHSFPIMFLRFCIAYYHAVPMSLYVVYEMLKLVLGFQVNVDKQMVHEGEGAVARTADLMEEMGQVDFIFSDKTGTLTANEMVFARGHADGQDLGDFRKTESSAEPEGVMNVKNILAKGDASSEAVAWYFTCLATCHEVVLEVTGSEASTGNKPSYTGMSPDEVALVTAAQQAGITFQRRNRLGGGICELEIQDPTGKVSTYRVPEVLQFNSDRKRMSVILQSGGRAWCITKGADSVMEGLLHEGFPEAAKADIAKFAKTGLRVLVIAAREIDNDWLQGWLMDYQKARGIFDETKESKIKQVIAEMEKDLRFVGLTAVEDRLQDGVPTAIETLKAAGSRLWVLTGDKTETAVEIAKACALFTAATNLVYCVDCTTKDAALMSLKHAASELSGATDAGLVIDGGTLLVALTSQECRELIFTLGMASQSCICTRLSPMQKLQLVQLVREADVKRITLTIGDGANDVPMILGGHVGVGIRGKEGAAAVQVCDIAISQFRFLVPLLLCHGRRSYRRVAVFFCYYLYKNFVLLMADLVWMFWDNFQGNIAFPEYLSIAFNAFFTSWHVLFVLGFDKDVPDTVACSHPELYKVGPQRRLFNRMVFSKWMIYAVLHGAVAWLVPFWMVGTSEYGTRTFWIASTAAFTNVIHITLFKMIIAAENPFRCVTLAPTFVAWFMFVAYLWGIGYTALGWSVQPNMKSIPENIVTQGDVFATLLLGPAIALALDILERLVQRNKFPTDLQKAEFEYKAGSKV